MSKNSTTWNAANTLCKKYGGHLVTVTSFTENQAIVKALDQKKIKNNFWIGYTKNSAGTWSWATGEKSNYVNWHIGEPNNGGGSEFYALMFYSFGFDWLDIDESMTNPWNTGALYILEIE